MAGLLSKVEAGWPAKVLGVVLAVIGVILIIGGVQLAMLGGSWYYLLAGLALAASGGLIFTGRVLGVWVNLDSETFENVPMSYSVATTRPLQDITEPNSYKQLSLGASNLYMQPADAGDSPATVEEFTAAGAPVNITVEQIEQVLRKVRRLLA